ncbi:phosphohydrolase [Pandoraea cepalis]|uniref:Phosphohydrolase n=1 Tax=Pandoraea cepalis TaxID=2508294 RepID=A0AAW7MHP9_9BURK|nr:HD domain-containing protein [Pandoraea cepalis]MDN4572281.1 phosphohydrolase [Pandoraea cepalis]MDN4576888.1 phosphohydrolase [Pandoraea cepalis]
MSNLADMLSAIHFAADRHKNQRRKDVEASPYINHPIAVAHLLSTTGKVTEVSVLQAAILHDTIEDTHTTFEELRLLFGQEVATLVAEVSDDKSLPKQLRKELQVQHAAQKSRKAAMIKIADATCNLRDLTSALPLQWSIERKKEYFDWAARVVAGLHCDNAPLLRAFEIAHELGGGLYSGGTLNVE